MGGRKLIPSFPFNCLNFVLLQIAFWWSLSSFSQRLHLLIRKKVSISVHLNCHSLSGSIVWLFLCLPPIDRDFASLMSSLLSYHQHNQWQGERWSVNDVDGHGQWWWWTKLRPQNQSFFINRWRKKFHFKDATFLCSSLSLLLIYWSSSAGRRSSWWWWWWVVGYH